MTLKDLMISYDMFLLEKWDHTATLASLTYNLTTVVINITSKSKIKPRAMTEFHPYREKKQKGMKINPGNIKALKGIANVLAGNR